MKWMKLGGLLAAMSLSAAVYAADLRAADLQVEGAWVRATAPGQDAAMLDLTLTSAKSAQLTGFNSPAGKGAQMHSMTHDNGMMKMREVQAIELPAGKRVTLGEAGFHLMLLDLKAPLKAGDSVPLTLNIKVDGKAQQVEARAEVRPLTEAHDMHHMHH